MKFVILLSKQGKVRLAKWYAAMAEKDKAALVRELAAVVPLRRGKMSNVLEYKDMKIVYRRYASLYFLIGIGPDDNELLTLDAMQRYVELLDKAYGNVCELDIVFNFQLAYHVLDELMVGGVMCEPSMGGVLQRVALGDTREEDERIQYNL